MHTGDKLDFLAYRGLIAGEEQIVGRNLQIDRFGNEQDHIRIFAMASFVECHGSNRHAPLQVSWRVPYHAVFTVLIIHPFLQLAAFDESALFSIGSSLGPQFDHQKVKVRGRLQISMFVDNPDAY